jgi:predicted nucleic acid-binding protein
MRAVLDTNVVISAMIIRGGKEDQILRAWQRGAFEKDLLVVKSYRGVRIVTPAAFLTTLRTQEKKEARQENVCEGE